MRTGIVAFLIGNISLLYWHEFPDITIVLLIFGLSIILTAILYKAQSYFVSLAPILLQLCYFMLFILLGFVYTALYIKFNIPILDLEQREGQTLTVIGHIDSIPRITEKSQRFEFQIRAIEGNSSQANNWDPSFSGKVRLSWYNTTQVVKIGQLWQMSIRLKKPAGLMNPGSFDYEKWLYHNRIQATGYVREAHPVSDVDTLKVQGIGVIHDSLASVISDFRQSVSDHLDELLHEYPYKGLIKALTIGYRHDMSTEQWRVFMHTGTNHLIAISGLHIGLIAALTWFLTHSLWKSFARLNMSFPAFYVASITALCTAIVYAALAGFSIPTQRALIMLLVVFLARLLKREISSAYIILLALLVVLLFDPLSVLAPGFWLSFGAVGIIVLTISARLSATTGINRKIYQFGLIQWAIFIGLLPMMSILLHQFSLVSPLANMVAVPIMSFIIVPLTLLFTFVSLAFETPGLWLFNLLLGPVDILFEFLHWMSARAETVYYLREAPWYLAVLIISGCLWLLLPRGWPGRWLGIVLLIPVFFWSVDRPQQGEVQLTVLDVGQGLAMIVQTAGHTLLFDTGDKFNEQFNMADLAIIPYLRLKGIRHLDKVIVSHSDKDHAGSLVEILEQIKVKDVLSGEPDRIYENLSLKPNKSSINSDHSIRQCIQGQRWYWDEVSFEILSPLQLKKSPDANNNSCVVLIKSTNGISYLLTGDIEKEIEKQLLNTYPDLQATVLQVPHHGSKTSSSAEFIKQLQPQIALFSYGYKNRFRHPYAKVVQQYKKRAVKLYTTSNGAIDIRRNLSNNSLSVKQYRLQNRRFWHREAEQL